MSGVRINGFIDDAVAATRVEDVPVLTRNSFRLQAPFQFIVGIGDNRKRSHLFDELSKLGQPVNLVHPFSCISQKAEIGIGVAVMPGVVVNTGVLIADNVILNTSSSVDHDCAIDRDCHICPGVHLAGNVCVGAGTFIGTGSSVIPGIRIGSNCVIGAGSVIVRDVPDNSKVFGVPGRIFGPVPV
jgi:sugar O-acyltransferase (sialic acid O-acetyltransferase NeuD family)